MLAAFRSQNPVAVNFRDAKLKDALQVVCEPYNLNFVFDKNADNLDVSVSARNVNFEQAFNMILQAATPATRSWARTRSSSMRTRRTRKSSTRISISRRSTSRP